MPLNLFFKILLFKIALFWKYHQIISEYQKKKSCYSKLHFIGNIIKLFQSTKKRNLVIQNCILLEISSKLF
jgi:hypothetical protein